MATETGEQVSKKVTATIRHWGRMSDLVLADGTVLTTTEDHPYWAAVDQRFECADELSPGERVLSADGRAIGTAWREVEYAEGHEPSAETPMWLRFVTPPEVRYHEARGRAYLGDLDKAAAVYSTGAEEQADPRNTTNYRAALASTLARAGDTSTAIAEGVTVLTSLEESVSSWRSLRQLEPVRSAAATHRDGEEFQMRFDRLKAIKVGAA